MIETRKHGREELKLIVSVRAIKELGLVYRSQLDVLRELIQNAIDARASEIRISFDEVNRQLVFEHNGEPIEGEYLDAFLTVGTDFKARSGGQYIGFFGIGRLSWLLVGHTTEIITGSSRLVWREGSLDVIEREQLPAYFNGVKWIIHLRNDVALSVDEIRSYVEQNYHGDVPVYINGARARRLLDEAELIHRDSHNEVYLLKRSIPFGLIVKGVFTVERDYEFKRILIRTSDPRVKVNPARGLVWDQDYEKWRKEVALKTLESLHQMYTPSELYRTVDIYTLVDLAEVAFPTTLLSREKAREMYRSRIRYLVFRTIDGGFVRGSDIDPEHWVYTVMDVTDTTARKLANKGIGIIYADPPKVEDWLKEAGFRRVDEVAIEEEARRVVSKDLEEKLGQVYRNLKSIVADVVPSVRYRPAVTVNIGGTSREVVVEEKADVVEIRFEPVEYPEKVHVVRAKVVGRLEGLDVVLVDHKDENVMAFTDGRKIYVNVSNPRIRELLNRTRRIRSEWKLLMMWAPILAHEMLHMYGYDHTDPEWHELYEDIIMKVNERILSMIKSKGEKYE